MVYSNRLVALSPPGLSLFPLQVCHILSCRSSRANHNETSAVRYVTKVRISREMPFSHDLKQTVLTPLLVVELFDHMPDLHQQNGVALKR